MKVTKVRDSNLIRVHRAEGVKVASGSRASVLIARTRTLLKLIRPRSLRTLLSLSFQVRKAFNGRLSKPTDFYIFYQWRYILGIPTCIRRHRRYFSKNGRGFGENAFHAAWLDVLNEFKPQKLLEIGVYRGQTISLWQLIANRLGMDVLIVGISPMDESGDSVSNYIKIDYKQDILSNFKEFQLQPPTLIEDVSLGTRAINVIESELWDLIYIDGSHDYDIVVKDYENAISHLRSGGILCFDDSSLYLGASIDGFFLGHHGPSRVANERALLEMDYLFTVGHNNFFRKR